MKIKVIIHQAEEGGYWAEVPAIPGCLTQGNSWEELIKNIYEAVEACLSVDVEKINIKPSERIFNEEIVSVGIGVSLYHPPSLFFSCIYSLSFPTNDYSILQPATCFLFILDKRT